jgi:hypothetical protein
MISRYSSLRLNIVALLSQLLVGWILWDIMNFCPDIYWRSHGKICLKDSAIVSSDQILMFRVNSPQAYPQLQCLRPGDQIGWIFAYCVILYFGHFFENDKKAQTYGIFFPRLKLYINFGKNGCDMLSTIFSKLKDVWHRLICWFFCCQSFPNQRPQD